MGKAIKEILLTDMSRFTINRAAIYIGTDEKRFAKLISLMLTGENPLPQRAAWAVSVIGDRNPELLQPFVNKLIDNIAQFEHPALTRCILRYLGFNPIPEEKFGLLLRLCYSYLLDLKTPIAVRVYAMQIIFNISEKEPDLKEELRLTIESLYDTGSTGFQNRAGKLLTKLNKKSRTRR